MDSLCLLVRLLAFDYSCWLFVSQQDDVRVQGNTDKHLAKKNEELFTSTSLSAVRTIMTS